MYRPNFLFIKQKMINISIVLFKTPKSEILNIIGLLNKLPQSYLNQIYVIDNSPDKTNINFHKISSTIKYFHTPHNPGYGAGHNIAIRESLSKGIDFHLVLNTDVYFDIEMLLEMIKFLQKNINIDMLSPFIYFPNGNLQQRGKLLPTPLNMFFRALLPRSLRKKIDGKYELTKFDSIKPYKVPYISGAFMLIRTKVLSLTGIFDERFFMYPEDIDLSRRIASISTVVVHPEFKIYHEYNGETRKSLRMFIIHTYNMMKYFNKWGWFFDLGRKKLNNMTLKQFKEI